MLLFADHRVFPSGEDRFQHCTVCGKNLVVLPDDRRAGVCFDCQPHVGVEVTPCPVCGSEAPPSVRALGCPDCGFVPRPEPR